MKASTVHMLRAWLIAASLAACAIDAAAIVALSAFHLPERVFESGPFRAGVVVAIALALVATRRLGQSAFRSALASRHAIVRDTPCQTVWLAADCPLRLFVVFHLSVNRARLARGDATTSTDLSPRTPVRTIR